MAEFGWKADEAGIPIIAMTSTEPSMTEDLRHEIQAPFEFMVTDKTTLKTNNAFSIWCKIALCLSF